MAVPPVKSSDPITTVMVRPIGRPNIPERILVAARTVEHTLYRRRRTRRRRRREGYTQSKAFLTVGKKL